MREVWRREWRRLLCAAALAAKAGPAAAAPDIPQHHIPLILQAAQEAEIEPALLAAIAARESYFAELAFRREPRLPGVLWRGSPGAPLDWFYDGSIGPMQILRSTFRLLGVDNDAEAYDLATNYGMGAKIMRWNIDSFPGDLRTAIVAYNAGQYWAARGYEPKGGYVQAILGWMEEYRPVFEQAQPPVCVTTEQHLRQWYAEVLGREPESWGVIAYRLGRPCDHVYSDIYWSNEAIQRRG